MRNNELFAFLPLNDSSRVETLEAVRASARTGPTWPYGVVVNIFVHKHYLLAEEHWSPKKLMQVFGTTTLSTFQLQNLIKQKAELLQPILKSEYSFQIVIRLAGTNGTTDQQGVLLAWGSTTGFD